MPTPSNHGRAWTRWRTEELYQAYLECNGIYQLAERVGRTPTAVESRLRSVLRIPNWARLYGSYALSRRDDAWDTYQRSLYGQHDGFLDTRRLVVHGVTGATFSGTLVPPPPPVLVDPTAPVQTEGAVPPTRPRNSGATPAQPGRQPFTQHQQAALLQAVRSCRSLASSQSYAAFATAIGQAVNAANRRFSLDDFRRACHA